MATITLTEQAGSTGYFTFSIKASVSQDSPKDHKKYWIKWTYSPITAFAERKTKQTQIVAGTSVTEVFTDLKPSKSYIIEAELVTTLSSTEIEAVDTISISTLSLGAEFACTSRSSSVIAMTLSGLPAFDFESQVELQYKRYDATTWKTVKIENIEQGETKDISYMFTGLTQGTRYEFVANLYKGTSPRGRTLIETFDVTTSTYIYDADLPDVVMSMDSLTVPHTGKGIIYAEVSDELPDGFTIHLLASVNGTEIDLGTFGDTMIKTVRGIIGSSVDYKLALVDRNGNRYNPTEPKAVAFTDISWTDKVAGNVVDLTASEVYAMADAMIKLVKYRTDALGEGDTYGKNFMGYIRWNINTIYQGNVINGGIPSIISALYPCAKYYAHGIMRPAVDQSGEPVGASYLNETASLVILALENII